MIKIEKNLFFILALFMALIITLSNYLVQFPFDHFGLENLLTYGAFSYPVAFLITDLANRRYGKNIARKIVYIGFILGVILTLCFSTDISNLISKRIAVASGVAFLSAQLFDIKIFDKLGKKIWYAAPLTSSVVGSVVDTFLFFSIAFYGTEIDWLTLSFGDLLVKIFVALVMLNPFKILISRIQDISNIEKKISV